MTNPPYILEHLDEMVKILNHPRVYAFLHVPVQAASDRVLYGSLSASPRPTSFS
jgi:threonylcarbamoyladenosine tRNA methylthiotransferase CDKAL1